MRQWHTVTIFDPRRNSIGFMRLVMATAVIVSHAWPLGGFGTDPGRANNNPGSSRWRAFSRCPDS